jgi:hypothetical protein
VAINPFKPHLKQQWVIPPQASSAFAAAIEDVLAVYKRPRDGSYPLVCLDETSKQLLADTRAPIPMKPGQPERRDKAKIYANCHKLAVGWPGGRSPHIMAVLTTAALSR